MPFQVVLSSSLAPPGEIISFTAGEDQIAPCTPNITLTAEVDGVLSGHTLLWEQIAGNTSNVVFTSPLNQLVVTYTVLANNYVDRTFRFWLDKGTPFQQFDDIDVNATPTAKVDNTSIVTTQDNFTTYYGSNTKLTLTIHRGNLAPEGSEVCSEGPTYYLRWTEPSGDALSFQIQEKIGYGSWTTIATVSGDTNIYTTLTLDKLYRVVAVYPSSTITSSSVWTDPVISTLYGPIPGIVSVDPVDSGSIVTSFKSVDIINYNVALLVKITNDIEDEVDSGSIVTSFDSVKITNYNVVDFSLIFNSSTEETDSGSIVMSFASVKIPQYDVLDLSGGDIGGG